MDNLDALYCRKTVYKFTSEKVSDADLNKIRDYFYSFSGVIDGIDTDIEIIDNGRTHQIRTGLFSSSAPYYIIIYSQDSLKKYFNVGYKMQKLALYLCTLGLGSQFMYNIKLPAKLQKKDSMEACAVLAFGHSKGDYVRARSEAVRMSSVQLSIYQETPHKWISTIIEAARFAPSYKNSQPWRFLVDKNDFHVYTRDHDAEKMKRSDQIDFGGMYANITTAAEELWLEVDLIRMDNIKAKQFKDDQYVISVFLRSK